ncbi:unnamed protein product [Symbiodinium sp. CCMP2592]|nr:unnamed protein product [Symbiodinium sp. CCMP2592]
MADDSSDPEELAAGPGPPPQGSGNPFSPLAGASSSNEGRLMQVLEMMAGVLRDQQSSSAARAAASKDPIRAKDIAKVVKGPEPFTPTTRDAELAQWGNWSWELEQWLSCIDEGFTANIKELRGRTKDAVVMSRLSPEDAGRSRLLYTILASLLNDKNKRMLRSIPDQNGFEGYRRLIQELTPSSRGRILALVQALHSWPPFDNKLSLMPQLAKFEAAVQEYEQLSGSEFSNDQQLAAVLRCLTGQLKTQATVLIGDTSQYSDLRSLIERRDASQTRWGASIASSYGLSASSSDHPVPMEEGKQKGARQVQSSAASEASTSVPSSASAMNAQASAKAKQVNRLQFARDVPVISLDQQDDDVVDLTIFSLDENDGGEYDEDSSPWRACMVRQSDSAFCGTSAPCTGNAQVSCPMIFDIACDDEDDAWTLDDSPEVHRLSQCSPAQEVSINRNPSAPASPCSPAQEISISRNPSAPASMAFSAVRAVTSASQGHYLEMVVDSGADVSCMPQSLMHLGVSCNDGASPVFVDAQGAPLAINDRRTLLLQLPNLEGKPQSFQNSCVVGSVSSPLFAVGKLYKLGWSCFWCGDQFVLGKQGEPSSYVPLHFKHNSLVAYGWIRRVQVPGQVRVVAQLGKVLNRLLGDETYFHELITGIWGLQTQSAHYIDVHEALPNEGMTYRTTLVKRSDGNWHLLEMSERIDCLDTASAPLPGVSKPVDCICLAHRVVCGPSDLGFTVDGPLAAKPSGSERAEPDDVPEVAEGDMQLEVEGQAAGAEVTGAQKHSDVAPDAECEAALEASQMDVDGKLPDEIEVQGVTIRPTDTLKTMREACTLVGIGKSGGKQAVYARLHNFCKRYELQQKFREPSGPEPNVLPPVREPTEDERQRHEVTHLPYASWCSYCQMHKARDDMHKDVDVTQRGISILSFDFAFTGREEGEKTKQVSLVLHYQFTGWREAIPVPRRGGASTRAYLASEVTRLCNMLGYGTIKLRCDPEGVCLALRDAIVQSRAKLGHKTLFDQVAEGSHASNGAAESTVHQTRLQAGVLLSHYEEKTGCTVGTEHPLYS